MNAVGKIGSYIYRGVGTVSGPFHPFGGAIDIIVVEQPDGTFKSSPWYVRFGKFQGVLKNRQNLIKIEVNGVDAGFNMYLAHTGQAYFLREEDVIAEAAETSGSGSGDVYAALSSGDEADPTMSRLPLKSKSCNYDSASPRNANGKIVGKPGILGFVFGGRESKLGDEDGSAVGRVSSMERAEIAADLLDVKWSTNIKYKSGETVSVSEIGHRKKEGSLESVVDSDSILETPLVASPTLRFLDEKEQDFRERNNVDGYFEENASLVVENGSGMVLSVASEGSGEVEICVEPIAVSATTEPLAQDTVTGCDTQELLSVPESVVNVTAGLVDLEDVGSTGVSQEGSSSGSPVQDENKITKDDMHFVVGNFEDMQSTSGASILQPEIEDEQFSFRDDDECKPGGSSSGGSTCSDTVEVYEKEAYSGNEMSDENGAENSKALSEPIDIERKKDIPGGSSSGWSNFSDTINVSEKKTYNDDETSDGNSAEDSKALSEPIDIERKKDISGGSSSGGSTFSDTVKAYEKETSDDNEISDETGAENSKALSEPTDIEREKDIPGGSTFSDPVIVDEKETYEDNEISDEIGAGNSKALLEPIDIERKKDISGGSSSGGSTCSDTVKVYEKETYDNNDISDEIGVENSKALSERNDIERKRDIPGGSGSGWSTFSDTGEINENKTYDGNETSDVNSAENSKALLEDSEPIDVERKKDISGGSSSGGSTCSDTVKVYEKETYDDNDISDESGAENSKATSEPIDIERNKDIHGGSGSGWSTFSDTVEVDENKTYDGNETSDGNSTENSKTLSEPIDIERKKDILGGSSSGGSAFSDTVEVYEKETYDGNEISDETGAENSKALSEPTDIEREKDISGESSSGGSTFSDPIKVYEKETYYDNEISDENCAEKSKALSELIDVKKESPSGSSSGGSTFSDTVEVDEKETSDDNEISGENGAENSKPLSEPIDIERKKDIPEEETERLGESLPIMRLHNNNDIDASPCQPLSQSFDPSSQTSKWDLGEAELSSGIIDAEKVAEASPNLKAFKHVIANPAMVELSLSKHLLRQGMGVEAASQAFNSEKLDMEKFASLGPSVLENDKLVVKIGGCYFPWDAAAPIILGMVTFGTAQVFEPKGMIAIDRDEKPGDNLAPGGGSWKLWPFSRRGSKNDSETSSKDAAVPEEKPVESPKPVKKTARALTPTSEQLASLDLKEGMNSVTFTFSTNIVGTQQVDARIYLWKWDSHIVVSDVDGTITRSDVLGQFMPLVGIDWSQTGVTHLFSGIKENGYQLIFLSARAISQASVTRQFLVNLKQNGKALPDGPVVISPDGLFPSLFREVIRRAPHEFKIACLEEIRGLFPPEHNPFYAGFGNRDTDEISYLRVGIPLGKIFIINPKGEVAVNRRVDTRSYTNLHTLVNRMFPATTTTSSEKEDFNAWNFWKLPPPSLM